MIHLLLLSLLSQQLRDSLQNRPKSAKKRPQSAKIDQKSAKNRPNSAKIGKNQSTAVPHRCSLSPPAVTPMFEVAENVGITKN